MKLETRGVLAGAYTGRMKTLLTHTVELDADGREIRVLCNRVQLDSLADAFALSEEERHGPPTCKTCYTRWSKLENDRQLGQAFADSYFALERASCSAWEWFILKSTGDRGAARRRWKAVDMDRQLRVRNGLE